MLKFSKLALILTALSMPYLLEAKSKYDLDDFEGNYISYTFSTGGAAVFTTGGPGPVTIIENGQSISAISQFYIDKRGNGIVNFLSYTSFIATDIFIGFVLNIATVNGSPTFTFTVQITDPIHGAGNFVFNNYPVSGQTESFDFVAIKNDGKIREIDLNCFSITPASTSTIVAPLQMVAKRQKGC